VISEIVDNKTERADFCLLANASVAGYFVLDGREFLYLSDGVVKDRFSSRASLLEYFPMLSQHLDPAASGTAGGAGRFYKLANKLPFLGDDGMQALYAGPVPGGNKILGIIFSGVCPNTGLDTMRTEVMILSLIARAIRAFNRAEDLEEILKLVLIGVTAGSGLGFNRAFIFLTSEDNKSLVGALANGPSTPEEAGHIWQRLSRGELTLEMMFDEALKKRDEVNPWLNGFLKKTTIPLDNKDNIFAQAALERKSRIICESDLRNLQYGELYTRIGPGPLAVVPLVGAEYLQGVLIADNFITGKEINNNDLMLLEIFAKYASDSIEKFRLYERLERKIEALKKANETILLSRENMIQAERLTVLAEMAGEVAHEIRNPLTVIGGFAKSMIKKMAPGQPNYEYLKIMYEQVARIERAIEKFTSLTNYKSKDDRPCELVELLKSALVLSAGAGSGRFLVTCGDRILVKLDPDLVRQALIIVLKRVHATQDGERTINLTPSRSGNKAFIFFEATDGRKEFAEELYKSFHASGDHKNMRQVATSLEIIKYYGGNLGLETRDDGSSKFYLELPVYEEGK